ncbi:hypothetical protein [Pseudoxanthomonas sp. 3HH-4]|uniref:hypothetical protein n=1 Tax=Pseudoxanthomonas sp. 3HH-4 TaxID=1690214 RepID=UPI001153CFF9|nr:hypothetical protein [Pseudoxanthomonas sp. 3HH-4]
MIQIRPFDLLAINENGRYYYCLALSDQIMAGGQLVYAFYYTSESVVTAGVLLSDHPQGFHRIVDFIAAKRSGSLTRIAAKVTATHLDNVQFFRQDGPTFGLDRTWAIWDREGSLVRRPVELTVDEWSYPIFVCSLHSSMCEQIDQRWHPSHDRAGANNSFKPNPLRGSA